MRYLLRTLADLVQYHDDGEHELDDLVSTWSLGSAGDMTFRIKKRHAHPILFEAKYDPTAEFVMGSDFWEERMALNSLYHPQTMGKYKAEKSKLFQKIGEQLKRKAGSSEIPGSELLQRIFRTDKLIPVLRYGGLVYIHLTRVAGNKSVAGSDIRQELGT